MKSKTSLALMMGFALLACDDGSSSNGGNTGPNSELSAGLPASNFPAEASKIACSAFERCFGPASGLFFQGQRCIDGVGRELYDSLSGLSTLVETGRVTYDPVKAEECLVKLDEADCAELDTAFDTVCDAALAGTVATGGDCDRDVECRVGSSCVLTAAACPGKCTAEKQAGATCSSDEECATGLRCDAGACKTPAALGQPCGEQAGGCAFDGLCAGEDQDTGAQGTCTAVDEVFSGKEGAPCDILGTQLCGADLYCAVTAASPAAITSTCQATVGKNGSCNFGIPSPCPITQYCDADIERGVIAGRCVDLPAADQACASAPGAAECRRGLVCVGADGGSGGTCKLAVAVGDACEDDAQCSSRRCLDGKCVAGFGCAL